MGAPVSAVEVCNLSLDLLRHSTLITSIETPESEEESIAARWYDATRRSALRMFPWNFARKRDTISLNVTAPAFGYGDAYDLPVDFISYVFVGDDPVNDNEIDFTIEGSQLLIDNDSAASLNLCYVSDFETVAKFDPIFLNLLVADLAIVFGNSITGLNKSLAGMIKLKSEWEAKARAKNGQENPPRIRHTSSILTKRRGARRSGSSDGTHLFS